MSKRIVSSAIFLWMINMQVVAQQPIPIMQGKNEIFIFLGDKAIGSNIKNADYDFVKIYLQQNGKQVELATQKSADNASDFARVAGRNVMDMLRQNRSLNSDEAVLDFVKNNAAVKNFGIAVFDKGFMQAIGVLYIHNYPTNKSKEESLQYMLAYYKANNKVKEEKYTLGLVNQLTTTKPVLVQKLESDSLVSTTWYLKKNNNVSVSFANVYVADKKGNFNLVGTTTANVVPKSDSILFKYQYFTTPGFAHQMYVAPCNYAGLEGIPSDMETLLSVNFETLPKPFSLRATDTINGIALRFTPPAANPLLAGIIIERSRTDKTAYVPIDTIATTENFYVDDEVLPNVTYYYQLRLLTIRQSATLPSAWGSAKHTSKKYNMPFAPISIKAVSHKEGIRLSWEPTTQLSVEGFKVYRNSYGSQTLREVSLIVRDTFFIDSTAKDAHLQYKYAVTTVNHDGEESKLSDAAFAYSGGSKEKLLMPVGLQAAAEPGRILLRWNDMRTLNKFIAGYKLYRKEASANEKMKEKEYTVAEVVALGFKPMQSKMIDVNSFADAFNITADHYLYFVSSMDERGNESAVAFPLLVNIPAIKLMPPPNFTARKTTKGVVLTWDKNEQAGVKNYAIYRRESTMAKPVLVAQVSSSTFTYIDKISKPSSTVYYSVATVGVGGESAKSLEKGVVL
jgi:fibronectin type 3 domain-containing protein